MGWWTVARKLKLRKLPVDRLKIRVLRRTACRVLIFDRLRILTNGTAKLRTLPISRVESDERTSPFLQNYGLNGWSTFQVHVWNAPARFGMGAAAIANVNLRKWPSPVTRVARLDGTTSEVLESLLGSWVTRSAR